MTSSIDTRLRIGFTAWYHAASAMTLLILFVGAAGLFLCLRSRSRRRAKIGLDSRPPRDAEERVPLGQEVHELDEYHDRRDHRQDFEAIGPPLFELGEDDLDDDEEHRTKRKD
jgi:hypothetical protein